MLYTKYHILGFRHSGSRQEGLFCFPIQTYAIQVIPCIGSFWPLGHYFTKLDRSLNGKALGLVVSDKTVLKVWYLIVLIPDRCTLTYFAYIKEKRR